MALKQQSRQYILGEGSRITWHGGALTDLPAWLADFDAGYNKDGHNTKGEVREFNMIDAMAASGDYFITLATRLDKMAQGMAQDSAEQIELEHLIKTLFYMQEHYLLVAKYKLKH